MINSRKSGKNRTSERGLAAIQVVMILTAMLVVVGAEIMALGFSQSMISKGEVESARAYRFAEAGARDALQRIARNKSYACATVDCYAVDMSVSGCANGDACSRVQVSSGVGSIADPKIITAKGIVNNKTRTVQVNVVLDPASDGEITTTTWSELTN